MSFCLQAIFRPRTLSLPARVGLGFGFGLIFTSSVASAMPGAPMMKLTDLTPACTPDPRALVLHEALGRTYPNDLPDWAEVVVRTIESLERSGALRQHVSTLERHVLNAAETPLPGVTGITLPRATAPRTFRLSVPPEAASALRGLRAFGGEDGLSEGASRFATSRPARTLLLINAEDAAQLAWAVHERQVALQARRMLPRIVVSTGTVKRVREALAATQDPDPRAWSDQGSTIRRRVGVTHLPARITTDPEGILVEEVVLKTEESSQ